MYKEILIWICSKCWWIQVLGKSSRRGDPARFPGTGRTWRGSARCSRASDTFRLKVRGYRETSESSRSHGRWSRAREAWLATDHGKTQWNVDSKRARETLEAIPERMKLRVDPRESRLALRARIWQIALSLSRRRRCLFGVRPSFASAFSARPSARELQLYPLINTRRIKDSRLVYTSGREWPTLQRCYVLHVTTNPSTGEKPTDRHW